MNLSTSRYTLTKKPPLYPVGIGLLEVSTLLYTDLFKHAILASFDTSFTKR